jgi:hypothetical protein
MATVNKDFKIKSGLIVEGTTATVNGQDILTKKQADQDYIVGLIGGTSTSVNTPNTVVKRNGDGDFAAGEITADLVGNVTGNADTATALETSRTIELTGDVTGSVSFDGTANVQISTSLNGSFATDAEVATAKAEAIEDAADYTDARETAITTAYQSYADTAEADAISAASSDATAKADAALASANSYTDDEIGSLDLSLKAYADQAETDAISTASADATSKANAAQAAAEATAALDATSKANAAQAAAELTASNANSSLYTTVTGDIATAKSEAISSANAYTDAEVAALVGQAPELLDTLNELSAAIANNPNYATDVANLVATKADTTYVDGEISDLDTAAQGYASAAQLAAEATASADATSKANAAQAAAEATAALDATSKADAAESDANIYTDGKITQEVADRNSAISSAIDTEVTNRNSAINSAIGQEVIDRNSAITTAVDALSTTDIEEGTNLYFTNQRAIDAVGGTIGDQIDLLTTDDIEEGINNQYFTDSRAKASAINLLTNASTENITIVVDGAGGGLIITAENGVADSTTSDLAEGSNLYFTDARAVDALEAVVPNFTAVELNSVAKQVAATLEAATAGVQTAYQFAKADYRSAEFLVKVAYGDHTEISKVLLTLDVNDNIAITEYGIVGTNGSASTISAEVNLVDNNVKLLVTTANNNSTVTVMGTLLV